MFQAGETCAVMRHHVHSVGGTVEGPEWGDRASMSTAVAPAVTGRWDGRGGPEAQGQGEACAWEGLPAPSLACSGALAVGAGQTGFRS